MARWSARDGENSVLRARILAIAAALLAAVAGLVPGPVSAQTSDDGGNASYITPFPGGERYRLGVVGDNLAEGIFDAFGEGLGSDPRVALERRHWSLTGLSRPDFNEEIRDLGKTIADAKPHVCVVLTGAQDRWSIRGNDGRRIPVGSREWRDLYGNRVDELIKVIKGAGAAVYWVGLPIMRRGDANEAARAINEVVRERAYLASIKYVDVYQGFADEDGEYSPYGPDIAGKTRLLRERDGIHMTGAGSAKLAHFIERDVKRDLSQAKNERAIPLAGDEFEQALISPTTSLTGGAAGPGATAEGERQGALSGAGGGSGDQKAETSRISLKSLDGEGREQVFAIDIVRPAIPAAVITAVTKRESADRASQMGDQILEQLPGGFSVMSSITPSGEAQTGTNAARRKVSAAQTPYFRVLVKGERIAQREGRADDTSWPRPDPSQALQPVAPPESVEPAADAGVPLPRPRPKTRR